MGDIQRGSFKWDTIDCRGTGLASDEEIPCAVHRQIADLAAGSRNEGVDKSARRGVVVVHLIALYVADVHVVAVVDGDAASLRRESGASNEGADDTGGHFQDMVVALIDDE